MKPIGVVTCIHSTDLEASLRFYRDCFQLPDLAIEEDMFTIELNGLSLFMMTRDSFESYSRRVSLPAHFPKTSVGTIFSCAIDDQDEIERILASAGEAGGEAVQNLQQNQWGQDVAYVRDPDGYVWELVLVPGSAE